MKRSVLGACGQWAPPLLDQPSRDDRIASLMANGQIITTFDYYLGRRNLIYDANVDDMKRILLVDDQRMSRFLFQNLFGAVCMITEATTVSEGLNLFKRQEFDVVFSDLEMPDRSGLEMMRDIRTIDMIVPCFIVTDRFYNQEIDVAINNGVLNGFIAKPYDVNDIYKIIL